MGQAEVLDWLRSHRLAGDESWYSASQIMDAFKVGGLWGTHSIYSCLRELRCQGWVEVQGPRFPKDINNWSKHYRYKLPSRNGGRI